MAYSPKRGLVAFTVAKFDDFLKRAIRGADRKRSKRKRPSTEKRQSPY